MRPARDESSSIGLELHHDVSQLQVSLLLKMGQHASAEEDLALTDAVQVRVQLQGLDLHDRAEVNGGVLLSGSCFSFTHEVCDYLQ